MYGLIGKMTAKPGQRDALAAAILDGSSTMPGNLSYIVAIDAADPDAIWVTEVWIDEASHKNSLTLPGVRAAIAKARPIIAGFGPSTVTTPIGGYGMALPLSPRRRPGPKFCAVSQRDGIRSRPTPG